MLSRGISRRGGPGAGRIGEKWNLRKWGIWGRRNLGQERPGAGESGAGAVSGRGIWGIRDLGQGDLRKEIWGRRDLGQGDLGQEEPQEGGSWATGIWSREICSEGLPGRWVWDRHSPLVGRGPGAASLGPLVTDCGGGGGNHGVRVPQWEQGRVQGPGTPSSPAPLP